ncbi:hypothetical protein LXL04_000303 [Taraxacum kok-saghyz]
MAMVSSKVFLAASTVVLLISVLLSLRLTTNNHSSNEDVEVIPVDGGAIGPESFDFNPVDGTGPYTGVSDGRIIKWIASEQRWTDFAVTSPNREGCGGPEMEHICGRTLGLKFDEKSGHLFIADAYIGLLSVGQTGGLATSLVSKVQGNPLMFTNSLDFDQTNRFVYFTDSSQRYTRRDHMLVVLTNDKTGSLLKYDIESKEVTVILHNLTFPNGVSLSQDGNFLLVAETTNCRILRFWLKTSKAGTLEVFADLPGYPDNIKRNQNGEFWVAMYSRKNKILSWIFSKPWIVYVLSKVLPIGIIRVSSQIAKEKGEGLAVKLGVDGEILETLEDVNGKIWKYASEVMERDGYLWIGSVETSFAIDLKVNTNRLDLLSFLSFSLAMLNSKLLLTVSTVVMLISLLLSFGFTSDNHLSNKDVEVIPIDNGRIGPESFDFNPVDGTGPYTGVSDGRIIKWIASERRWNDFAITSPHRLIINTDFVYSIYRFISHHDDLNFNHKYAVFLTSKANELMLEILLKKQILFLLFQRTQKKAITITSILVFTSTEPCKVDTP